MNGEAKRCVCMNWLVTATVGTLCVSGAAGLGEGAEESRKESCVVRMKLVVLIFRI